VSHASPFLSNIAASVTSISGNDCAYGRWEAAVLPLNYTRGCCILPEAGVLSMSDEKRGGLGITAAVTGTDPFETTS